MKATAVAPANIAFIKYWGRRDARLRIPANPSISMNLSVCTTTTSVEFSKDFTGDVVSEGFDKKRIVDHIDRIRMIAKTNDRVRVTTTNTFPASTGIASSASGFAALTVAALAALELKLSEKELTNLARLGSGSACRSIPDGFVKWEGEYAHTLYPHTHWDLRDIIVLVENKSKDVSSSVGHDAAHTSPFFKKRLLEIPERISRLENALRTKNFQMLGEVTEEDCLSMHRVMQTQTPPLLYWSDETKEIMESVKLWRNEGLAVYFTIDAGPNVHLMCEGKDEARLARRLRGKEIIINRPARGAHIL